jgi:hypothetical protein
MKHLLYSIFLMGFLLTIIVGCSIFDDDKYTINHGNDIHFIFDEGLNDDPNFRLSKDVNGFYHYELSEEGQNIQRISGRLLDNGNLVYSPNSGYRHYISWESNLYWWLLEGDTVVNITRRYFNPFTGEFQYVNLPPLTNWRDVLIPTINSSSITDERTGRVSTVIGPIREMKGDTMTVYVTYTHQITKQKRGSSFFEVTGQRDIRDSVRIVLK